VQLTNEAFGAVVEHGGVPRSSWRMVMVGSLYETLRSRILCSGLAAQELGW